jgi:hypothetical protein
LVKAQKYLQLERWQLARTRNQETKDSRNRGVNETKKGGNVEVQGNLPGIDKEQNHRKANGIVARSACQWNLRKHRKMRYGDFYQNSDNAVPQDQKLTMESRSNDELVLRKRKMRGTARVCAQ